MHVLVIEDEHRLAELLAQIMRNNKYQCDTVFNGIDGLAYAESGIYDVILLDIMLPGMNGIEVLKNIRKKKIATPVLLLTAKDDVKDKVSGLDSGADDYLTKPFNTDELLARVRALTRRQGEVILDEMRFGNTVLNISSGTLVCGEKSVRLGFKELEMMKLLMANPNVIIPKEDMITKVWGYDSPAEDNNVEVYVSFLRKKLAFICSDINVVTVRKIGYHLEIINK